MKLSELRVLIDRKRVTSFPVVEAGGLLVGVITSRDLLFSPPSNQLVSDVMTPMERLEVVREGAPMAYVQELMHARRIKRVLIVNECFEIRGMITAKDIACNERFPEASRDSEGRLRVGAAVGVAPEEQTRFRQLVEAGADAILIDSRYGHSHAMLSQVEWAKRTYPDIDVLAGNVLTGEGAQSLVDCGADGIKVGMGTGALHSAHGVGVPQLSALIDVVDALGRNNVPIIVDDLVRGASDVAKALAVGASTVTIDDIFSTVKNQFGGEVSGPDERSSEASGWSCEEESSFDAVKSETDSRRIVSHIFPELLFGLRTSMSYCGTKSIPDMHLEVNFVRLTSAAISETRRRMR